MNELVSDIRNILDAYIAKGAVGTSLSYALGGDEPVQVTAGLADRSSGAPVEPDNLFKIGSCTKTFVAAALMRLAQDGRVDAAAPISNWFPQLPGAEKVSVRQLVNHRGGLPEFEYDIPMTPGRIWSPQELVDLAFSVSPPAPSGGAAVYNNTGYVLAGMLIESITGISLGAYVRQALLDPLGLRDTFSPATEDFPSDRLVRGYFHRPPPAPDAPKDLASGGEMWRMDGVLPYSDDLQDSSDAFPYSGAYGCGDMVATPENLTRFIRGLFGGRVLDANHFEEMFGFRVPSNYPGTRMRETGAGLFKSAYGDRMFFGHQGSIPGYVCVMQHDPESGLSISLASNVGSGNRLSFQASGLHYVVDDVIKRLLR